MDFKPRLKEKRRSYYEHSGINRTAKHISHLLPQLLSDIGKRFEGRPDLILAAWPEVVGARLAAMTRATSFEEGVLFVRVHNSTLYSLLHQYDKSRIIQNIRSKFPNTLIKTVVFRLG